MRMLESDWKKFKELYKIALDRFCLRVLAEAETIAEHDALSPHARYRTLYQLMRDRDKDIVRTFDHYSRSSALMALETMVSHDLLTDAELSVLSDEAQAMVADVVRRPHKIKWAEEGVSYD
ncbi:hypothetical protein [Pseudomonas moorei]|uniref:hypothetical protein n=1 Tax=Pseudomonas moorei TaxID=395599 RepID=UPI00200CF5F4|nr:hypothetical protein [Pseudomonas moorei]